MLPQQERRQGKEACTDTPHSQTSLQPISGAELDSGRGKGNEGARREKGKDGLTLAGLALTWNRDNRFHEGS